MAVAAEEHLRPGEVRPNLGDHHCQRQGNSPGISQILPLDQPNLWPDGARMIMCMLHTIGPCSSFPASDDRTLPTPRLKAAMRMNLDHNLRLWRIQTIQMDRIMKGTTKSGRHHHQPSRRMAMIGPKSRRRSFWNHPDVDSIALLQPSKSSSSAFADLK